MPNLTFQIQNRQQVLIYPDPYTQGHVPDSAVAVK